MKMKLFFFHLGVEPVKSREINVIIALQLSLHLSFDLLCQGQNVWFYNNTWLRFFLRFFCIFVY
jgi:hypothetical protein